MPKRREAGKKAGERWIIVFDGPARNLDSGETVVRVMAEEDDFMSVFESVDEARRVSVFESVDEARRALYGHMMRPFAAWILNVNTGETESP